MSIPAKRYRRMSRTEKREYAAARDGVFRDKFKRETFRCERCRVAVQEQDRVSHFGRCWIEVVMGAFTKVS